MNLLMIKDTNINYYLYKLEQENLVKSKDELE